MFKKNRKELDQANEKLLAKYEKLGYNKEIVKLAIAKCSNPTKESSMLETLKSLTQEVRIANKHDQIDEANQKFINNAYKKYGELGYPKEMIAAALNQCPNYYNQSEMIDTLNLIRESNSYNSEVQIQQKFINNSFIKYGELGYTKEIINLALSKCANIKNENSMLDTLNMLTKKNNYSRVFIYYTQHYKIKILPNNFRFL